MGKNTAPKAALVSLVSYLYVAYKYYDHPLESESYKWKLYAAAGVANIAIVPFTLVVMMKTVKKLLRKADETAALQATETVVEVGLPKAETARALVDKWGMQNLIRAIFPLIGALLGVWTALD